MALLLSWQWQQSSLSFAAEIRDLGVGYFGFSTDPLERQRQMDELKRLREQV
jgi:hypothetical protein